MKPEVAELHRLHWKDACEKAKELISSADEATESIREFLATKGWRERYNAAIIISALRLENQISSMVEDFRATPEPHVCRAYTYMVLDCLGGKGLSYLKSMREACLTDPRGHEMAKTIDHAIENLSLA